MADLSAAGLEALAAQYYGKLQPGAQNLTAAYQAAAANATAGQDAALASYQAAAAQQQATQAAGYGGMRQDAARLAALSAIKGAGGVPIDGQSQTQQAMRANGYGSMIGAIGAAEKADADALSLSTALAGKQRDSAVAQLMASGETQRAAAQAGENQAGASRVLAALSGAGAAGANAAGAKYSEDAIASQKEQDAYNNAMTELKTFGVIMTRAASEALGVPIGTTKGMIKGRGKGGVKVVDFYPGIKADGTPERKEGEFEYTSPEEARQSIENAVGTGDDIRVKSTLQNVIYDGYMEPKEAQKIYNAVVAENKKSTRFGYMG